MNNLRFNSLPFQVITLLNYLHFMTIYCFDCRVYSARVTK